MAQVDFSLTQQTVGDYPVLTVHGEADMYSAPALQDALSSLLDAGGRAVVVDLTQVVFLDSTGLGVLVSARTRATENDQRLPVVCEDGRILKLFRITGLESVFEIHPSLDAALEGLGQQG